MADQLEGENYHAKAAVRAREAEIMARWQELLDLLKVTNWKKLKRKEVLRMEK